MIGTVLDKGRRGLSGRLPWIQAVRGNIVFREAKKESKLIKSYFSFYIVCPISFQ